MRQPIRQNARQRKSMVVSIPCPVGGWNRRNSLADMPIKDAITIDNWIPRETHLELRSGYTRKVNTSGEIIKTIFAFSSGSDKHLLYAAAGKIYKCDVTDFQVQELSSGQHSDIWQYVQYKNRLFMVNGFDNPKSYDGTTLTENPFSSTESGFDAQLLNLVALYKNRLFFAQKDSLKFWFTELAGNISGNLKSFDLAQLAKKGGSIASINNWTQTGAEGQNNQLVIISTEGEVFVYSGDDPTDSDRWALVGIYQIPRTVGTRNSEKLGGDIIVITTEGYFSLSSLLSAAYASNSIAFSDKINSVVQGLKNRFNSEDWQIKYCSSEGFLVINVPKSLQERVQHILNTSTGAWFSLSGVNATCFETLDNDLYFGGVSGNLYKMFDGNSDDGAEIEGYVQQAYTDCGITAIKAFKIAQFVISAHLKPYLNLSFGVDYKEPKVSYISTANQNESAWNVAEWDSSYWARGEEIQNVRIIIVANPGYKGSIGVKTKTQNENLKWYSTILRFEAAS